MSKFRKEAFLEKEDRFEVRHLFLKRLNSSNVEIYLSFTTERETFYKICGPESLVKAISIEKDATKITMSQESSPKVQFVSVSPNVIAVSPGGAKYPKANIGIRIGRGVLVTVIQCGGVTFHGSEGQAVIVVD